MRSQRQHINLFFHFAWLSLLLGSVSLSCSAQTTENNTSKVIARIYEQMTTNGESDIDFTTLEEDLNYFAQNPINLNNTTKEELDKLQFLSDQEVENLLYYLYRNGPMQTIYELQLVEGFDMFLIRNLLPFVTNGPAGTKQEPLPSLGKILKYGKNELLMRVDHTLEQKKGYAKTDDDATAIQNDKKYVGDPFYQSLKYNFRYKDRIEAGLVGEKDPGEQLWGRYHKGFDYYSAYLQLTNVGVFKSLVVGNFKANFGEGLVIHPELTYSKSGDVMNVQPHNAGISKSSSTNEYNYMRGIGTTLKFGNLEASAFYSFRYIDGDSTGSSFSYIKTDGLHRTVGDLDHKSTIWMQVMGVNLNYRLSNMRIGMTVVDTRLSRALEPTPRPDNMFYFNGNHQLVAGVNYRYRWKKFNFFGETATQDKGGIATLNGMTLSPISTVSFVALYRYYSNKYDVLLANAFSEGSRVNSEEGLYFGVEVHPMRKWKLTAYADSYSFPWLNYSVSRPTDGYDLLFTANFMPSRKVEMYWRFRYEQKEKDLAAGAITNYTGKYDKASLRYYLTFTLNEQFSLKNIVEVNRTTDEISKPSFGSFVSQELSYSFRKIPLSFDIRYELFDAVNYENRFYSYEKDVLYAFSVPMMYGKGSRYYFNCQWNISRKFSLWFKIAQIYYADTNVISSGLEAIQGNHKTDARAMIRFKF